MTILDLASRIVNAAREHESAAPYRFERAEFATINGAACWLRDWHSVDGNRAWFQIGERKREELARYWFFLRYLFDRDIREREAWGAERRIWGPDDGR